ncbi:hypothetical protein Ahy_B03g067974 isoform A [Arachis hypogaea]|uniref:Uncharacterized protein n=1 Tax=Arachis hypogaea TaxID=3818 RepID=A0A445A891_ARAHY|nr:hypothetical protein Ahy_B03g067974 isoform A [Arachis hypogaea]
MYICAHINRKNNLRCSLPPFANLTVVAPYGFASFFRRTLPDKYLILPILYSIQFANTKELQWPRNLARNLDQNLVNCLCTFTFLIS